MIALGTTGGIAKSTVKALQDKLKLTTSHVNTTCCKLHDLAIQMAHALVRKRRYLEYHREARTHRSSNTNNARYGTHRTNGTRIGAVM